jgi:hypothetical protein
LEKVAEIKWPENNTITLKSTGEKPRPRTCEIPHPDAIGARKNLTMTPAFLFV